MEHNTNGNGSICYQNALNFTLEMCENSDGVTLNRAPNRGGVYQKFAIFNQYFTNTDTDTDPALLDSN